MKVEPAIKAVEFYAYIPPLQSAIAFGDDLARIKLDIPAACRPQAKALVDFQGKRLRVMVEVMEEEARPAEEPQDNDPLEV